LDESQIRKQGRACPWRAWIRQCLQRENPRNGLALYSVRYNFAREHKTLHLCLAQAAGITDELLSMEDIANMIEAMNPLKKGGPYKKTAA